MQYYRFLQGELKRAGSRGKARLVLGARQTGKSTLFKLMAKPGDVFFDLQERSERLRLARDPESFTRSLLPVTKKRRHVFVDEVQRVPELLDEIQLLLDRYPDSFTFTLTGSSARRLRSRNVNLLPGRMHRFFLSPVSLWEQGKSCTGKVLPPPRRNIQNPFPERTLKEMLVFGNLPAAFTEGKEFAKTLESYAEVYVEEEVMRESAARNLGDYGRFLELAAIESGNPINLTKISQETGIALSTLRGFYAVLEDTLVGFSIRPFSRSGRARIVRTPKFYFFDVGVRNSLSRLPLDTRILATEGGRLLEHWVACELIGRIKYLGRAHQLSFWRTTDGAEVDFILEKGKEAIPIEVKYTSNPRPEDARQLEHFIKRYGRFSKHGYVVCRTSRQEQLTPCVRAIPWQEL